MDIINYRKDGTPEDVKQHGVFDYTQFIMRFDRMKIKDLNSDNVYGRVSVTYTEKEHLDKTVHINIPDSLDLIDAEGFEFLLDESLSNLKDYIIKRFIAME